MRPIIVEINGLLHVESRRKTIFDTQDFTSVKFWVWIGNIQWEKLLYKEEDLAWGADEGRG